MANVYVPSFYRHTLTATLNQAQILQKTGKHTVALLDYKSTSKAQYTMPESKTPVAMRWGKTPLGTRTFYGYVNHYLTVNEDRDTFTRMVLRGASQVFNDVNPTTWHEVTHSGIAREIARRHNFRSVITPSSRILTSWSTGNQSDFAALNMLADEAGYLMWIDGPTVYFLDADRILNSARNMDVTTVRSPQIRLARVTGGTDAPKDDTAPVRRRVLHGLDSRTNEFYTATGGSRSAATQTLGRTSSSLGEATQITAGVGSRDYEYYGIEVTMTGDASVIPGSLVLLDSDIVSNDQGGFWFVTEANHTISGEDFETRWVGVRGKNPSTDWTLSTVSGSAVQGAAVIRNGTTWEAEVQVHVNV